MNSNQEDHTTTAVRSFASSNFRLTYMDLYEGGSSGHVGADVPALATIVPTAEFPLLGDVVCLLLLGVAAQEWLNHMGGKPESSNVPLQGWVERYARKAGVSGWTPPNGILPLLAFRARVLGRIFSQIHHESLRKN
jgi:hypothetical protein